MIINLKQLTFKQKTNESFSFEEKGDNELLKDLEAKFIEPLKVKLKLEYTGRLFNGHGNVITELKLICSRCLKDINYSVNEDFYVTIVENAFRDQFKEDDDIIFTDDYIVDIRPFVIEALFINIPLNPLCNHECKGLCPKCGINKNNNICQCEEKDIDPRWEKLKKLK